MNEYLKRKYVLRSVTGMTSLEYWCFACIAFTFGSLVTYVIILLMIELSARKSKVKILLCKLRLTPIIAGVR